MYIREMNSGGSGIVNIDISYEELRILTNILCRSRKQQDFSAKEYELNAELIMATTLIGNGFLPPFERELITNLYDKANELRKESENNDY